MEASAELCYICDTPLTGAWHCRGDRLLCSHACKDAFISTTMHTIPIELLVDIRATTTPARLAKRAALRQHVDELLDMPAKQRKPQVQPIHHNKPVRRHFTYQRRSRASSRRGFTGHAGSSAWVASPLS